MRDWERTRRLVGGRIRAIRQEAQLSQEALALESGLSRNLLVQLEHGQRGVLYERLVDLARALDCTVAAFFDWSSSPTHAAGDGDA